MKKKNAILLLTIIVVIFVTGCGDINSTKKESEKLLKKYINELYTIKLPHNVNKLNVDAINSKLNLKKLMTSEAYNELWEDQTPMVLVLMATALKYSISVENVLVKKFQQNEDSSVTYAYNVKLNLYCLKDKKNHKKSLNGKVTLKRINLKWKVIKNNECNLENIITDDLIYK